MRTLELDYPGALAIVKRARPIIMPNQGFEEQLVLWRQMGCSVQDANGTDKLAYVRWKNSVEGVSSEDKVVGMKLGVGRLAAAIGRRRMHETDTRSGNAPTEEKRNGDGELVKQAQEEIGKGVTRVKEVLEKRRLGKERLRADGVEKE